MDIIHKNRLLTWGIVALLGVNTILLVLMWAANPQQRPMDGPSGGPGDFIIHELSFNDAQVKNFEELRRQHRQQADKLLAEMRPLRDSLFNFSSGMDINKVNVLTSQIGQKQAELEKVTYEHFNNVRTMCSDEQKKKFDGIIGDILKEMGRKPPPRK